MNSKKILSVLSKYKILILISFLTISFFFIRFLDSHRDVINPDSINWHNRSFLFIQGLKSGNYSETYQVYHPGITLMWVMGLGAYNDNTFYTKDTFLAKDFLAKYSLNIVQSLCFFLTLYLLSKFLKPSALLLFSFFIILEPFFLGVQRLVHLEGLLTSFLFLSFLFLVYFSLKSPKLVNLILSILFFVLAFYTKSSAVVILPVFILIFLLLKETFINKLKKTLYGLFFLLLFLYSLFPAVWSNPLESFPKYFSNIYEGVLLIGVEGKREVGNSGTGDNQILKDSHSKVSNFYIDAFFYTLSPAALITSILSILIIIYLFIDLVIIKKVEIFVLFKKVIKNDNFRLLFFSSLTFTAFFVAYSISTKSYERYLIVAFPYIFLIVTLVFNQFEFKLLFPVYTLYLALIFKDLIHIHPYYYSYGNSFLGGSLARYEKLNSPPFGVAVLEVAEKLSGYIKSNEKEYFPVLAGSKAFKAFFNDARNELYPNCDVDYFIQFYDDKKPKDVCIGRKYQKLFSIYVGNIEYWNVYKFERRSSKAKRILDDNKIYKNEN